MRQFRTENPIILAKEDVSKTPEFYKKGFNDAKILKPNRAVSIVCARKGDEKPRSKRNL